MLAFHNDPKLKAAKLRQLRAHAKADEIVKGVYWQNGKGCLMYSNTDKEVLFNSKHFADAVSVEAAELIVQALNSAAHKLG